MILTNKQKAYLAIVWASFTRGYSIKNIKWLLAQSAHETGNWKEDENHRWFSDKNLFGMSEMSNASRRQRLVGVRVSEWDNSRRAQFKNLWDSVEDRLDWDEQCGIGGKSKNYAKEVSAIYIGDKSYADKVSNRIADDINNGLWLSLIIPPVIVLIGIWYLT